MMHYVIWWTKLGESMWMCECDLRALRGGSVWIRGPYACHQGHHSGPSAPFLAPELQISHIDFFNHFAFRAIQYFFPFSSISCSNALVLRRKFGWIRRISSCDKTKGKFGFEFIHDLICCRDTTFQCFNVLLSTNFILICACLSSMMMKVASHG